jgi:hypothetical protein
VPFQGMVLLDDRRPRATLSPWGGARAGVGGNGVECTSSPRPAPPDHEATEPIGTTRAASTWGGALAPVRIRSGNTTTLLGTGELLVAGGGSSPRSTEVLDPYAGTVTLGPDMAVSRQHHTATVLQTGKVLLVGGGTANAELYDPIARTFAPTAPMSKARTGHVALRLRDGRVLVAGGEATGGTAEVYDAVKGSWTPTSARLTTGGGSMVTLATGKVLFRGTEAAELFDPTAAGGAGAWTTSPRTPPLANQGLSVMTLLRDGRLVTATGDDCVSLGIPMCMGTVWTLDFTSGVGNPVGPFVFGRFEPTAALLPDGNILYAGGGPAETVKTAELFTVGPPTSIATDGPTSLGHDDSTSVVLPGGDVLLVGGTQAAIDRRSFGGAFHDSAGPMVTPRAAHAVTRLHDGTLMISGGSTTQIVNDTVASVEIFDPTTDLFAAGGTMTVPRARHTATTLASGKVLLTGGATAPGPITIYASAEIYDPTAAVGARTHAVGAMSRARLSHAATLLPSGQVLVTGGCTSQTQLYTACAADGASKVAELFDPATEAFSPLPPMLTARLNHGAVVLPNGKVLIVGGGDASAELYDPLTRTFAATQPSGSPRDGRTAHLLPNGRVFVAGGSTLAPDLFDPVTETWSFAGALPAQLPEMLWSTRPDGRLVSVGGLFPVDGINATEFMFDPLGTSPQAASFVQIATDGRAAREGGAMTLAGTGDLVVTGGAPCHGGCFGPLAADGHRRHEGGPARRRLRERPGGRVRYARLLGHQPSARAVGLGRGRRGHSRHHPRLHRHRRDVARTCDRAARARPPLHLLGRRPELRRLGVDRPGRRRRSLRLRRRVRLGLLRRRRLLRPPLRRQVRGLLTEAQDDRRRRRVRPGSARSRHRGSLLQPARRRLQGGTRVRDQLLRARRVLRFDVHRRLSGLQSGRSRRHL